MQNLVRTVAVLGWVAAVCVSAAMDECEDAQGRPQRCMPEFVNAAFNVTVVAYQHLRLPPRGVLRADRSHRRHQVLPHLRRARPAEPPQRRVPDRLQQPAGRHLVAEPDHAGGGPVPHLHQPHPASRQVFRTKTPFCPENSAFEAPQVVVSLLWRPLLAIFMPNHPTSPRMTAAFMPLGEGSASLKSFSRKPACLDMHL
ncbi:Laminin subunit gamma-1 [Oryzias melastigma]|uniref:Laminin subunit gamma-1 n=1 Tax=Oryzias melastigma TaxID=30732 RepID=A0A834F3W1_ORYME|nr:Laminin subunit gamma-1 [Oryzias melastigma]